MIPLGEIYDKDVNFLFGSGASFGLLPTLRLGIKRQGGEAWSFEELATELGESDSRYAPLFMHYYETCIRPAQTLDIEAAAGNEISRRVFENYDKFLRTVLHMLHRRSALEKRCNLFTTNYDGCFELAADAVLRQGSMDFVLNDGTRGFREKILQARNFNSFLCDTGVFDRHQTSVPQINLIHLHGSVYWAKHERGIRVDYQQKGKSILTPAQTQKLASFSSQLNDSNLGLPNLTAPSFTRSEKSKFMSQYQEIPVVNPTKWKFHQTLYEEHYYQMLRFLSYELEKANAVLITFGFSFADEHILNLVKRSLSNPRLQVYVCCYSAATHEKLSNEFKGHRNVSCLVLEEGSMDFTAFNEQVLTVDESPLGKLGEASVSATPSAADGAHQ
ncbi:MAG: SIR2 family protein [Rhodocyclaceae bacterium]|jgi:hypothetical protein|nr:SIR2 family protein [Rhodocyclaceae bacterium]MCA3042399.1 SIR2 family protein [Rhodocyclaceae bacterium]MCA3054583.1 SIR2 family protein [Rhodocyclaceae bacterium]MCA3056417.1 SIR2 family protein [Rhodocyclaceae bacterium]